MAAITLEHAHEHHAAGVRHARDAGERLSAQHQVRGHESHVHHDDDADHEQRAERAELTARLHHLRNTERRALRRMQGHEDGAHQIADRERRDRPAEGQREHRHRQPARDDGEQHQVRAEPYREEIAVGAVAPIERYRLYGGDLDAAGVFAGFIHFLGPSRPPIVDTACRPGGSASALAIWNDPSIGDAAAARSRGRRCGSSPKMRRRHLPMRRRNTPL